MSLRSRPAASRALRLRGVGLAPLGLGVLALAAAATAAETTADGAFTEAQAERGKQVYEASCQSCHQADFYEERLRLWEDRSVGELFEAVASSMPADNVGALRDAEYLDVLAYVFRITGSPSGEQELTTDTMDAVLIARPGS